MEIYNMTLRQYQESKLKEYKQTRYWQNALKLKTELRHNMLESKMETWKTEWYNSVIEHGKENRLDNKVIYSFDKAYGRDHLMHCFRGNREGLTGWINSDAI